MTAPNIQFQDDLPANYVAILDGEDFAEDPKRSFQTVFSHPKIKDRYKEHYGNDYGFDKPDFTYTVIDEKTGLTKRQVAGWAEFAELDDGEFIAIDEVAFSYIRQEEDKSTTIAKTYKVHNPTFLKNLIGFATNLETTTEDNRTGNTIQYYQWDYIALRLQAIITTELRESFGFDTTWKDVEALVVTEDIFDNSPNN